MAAVLLTASQKPCADYHCILTVVGFLLVKDRKQRSAQGNTSKTLTSAPPEHSLPHSTQLQTTENVCRGSSSLSPHGIPPACTLKYVYIAIKVWHCASWRTAPQTGPDFECASVSPWQHLITPSVFFASTERSIIRDEWKRMTCKYGLHWLLSSIMNFYCHLEVMLLTRIVEVLKVLLQKRLCICCRI